MSGRDLGASVRQRLLNQARSQERPFQELLQYFAMERFLYRLSKSPSSDRFHSERRAVADRLAGASVAANYGHRSRRKDE